MGSFRVYAVLLLTAVMCLPAGAQLKIVPRERLESVVSPRLSRDSSSLLFDVRRIAAAPMNEDDPPSVYSYPFRNVGKDPVRIRLIRTTCSCLAAFCDVSVIQPGERASVTVRYDPEGHPGRFERKIFVYTQDGNEPCAVLSLNVTVASGADLSDEYPVQMGGIRLRRNSLSFRKGVKAVEKIRFINTGDSSLAIDCEEFFLPACIGFESRPARVEAGEEGELVISYDPASDQGRNNVKLMLKGLGVPPGQATLNIRIE